MQIQARETKGNFLAAKKRFGRYKDEAEKTVRKANVATDERLERIMQAWKTILNSPNMETVETYEQSLSLAAGLEYDAADIERFCIVLFSHQDEELFGVKAGLFLSALINNSDENQFSINTGSLFNHIYFLGFRNSKEIIVHGNAGVLSCTEMSGGNVRIEGTGGGGLGWRMNGGTIVVMGNGGALVGTEMSGGSIRVKGDVSEKAGASMKGGSIEITGNAVIGLACMMEGGRISVDGEIGVFDSPVGGGDYAAFYPGGQNYWTTYGRGLIKILTAFRDFSGMTGGTVVNKGKILVDK